MSKTKALPKNLSFEKALERLQEVVAEMEDPERGLEASLELFEEGVSLSRFCRSRIEEIQKRVEVVLKETADSLSTGPLDEDSDDELDDDEDAGR
ncbi:MAG TPA: exodeoxyribonuclease VII small subunit [Thermoanaerobaculia bacterium]|nr:exodeoxyribonuclease VII small subunit [Thermoanaerobaculia bacterium]